MHFIVNFFFPFLFVQKKQKVEALQEQINNCKQRICENDRKLSQAQLGKEPSVSYQNFLHEKRIRN